MSDKTYMKKEVARLELQDAVTRFFKAADIHEMGAQEIGDEICNTVFDATEESIKLSVEST